MKLKNIVLIIFMAFHPGHIWGQTEKKDYIFIGFDLSNDSYYSKTAENGEVVKEKSFIQTKLPNGRLQFFIEGTLFVHDPSVMKGNSLKTLLKSRSKMLKPEEILTHISKVKDFYPLGPKFPSDKFPRLIIVDTSGKEELLYEVKWQPFQE